MNTIKHNQDLGETISKTFLKLWQALNLCVLGSPQNRKLGEISGLLMRPRDG